MNATANTIALLSLYQRLFNFKGVVFTNSFPIKSFSKQYHLTVLPITKRNKFNMPVFRDMMITMKTLFQSKFYGYLNSDILMNPRIFDLLPFVLKNIRYNVLRPFIELACRVKVVDFPFQLSDFQSKQSCDHIFELEQPGYLRSNLTAV